MPRALHDLSHLPDWPARMRAPVAAAYLDVSVSTLLRGVDEGKYPSPHADGSLRHWHRVELDRWLAQQRGVEDAVGVRDPYDEALDDGEVARAAR